MQLVLLAAVLSGLAAPRDTAEGAALPESATVIAPQLQTGSLIFSQGDCLAVRVYSASPYTHVAAVVVEEGAAVVYDSMNGCGVRRLPLEQYLVAQAPERIHIFHPRQPLTDEQAARLAAALECRVGSPYHVLHHLTGRRSDEGVHCAEYVTDALMAIDLIHAERPANVSPASLAKGITLHEVYDAGETIELCRPAPLPETGSNWCSQLWIDTKLCCARCCDKMLGWFLCR